MHKHPKIFLSHSHRDRHLATALQSTLEKQGAEIYLDQDQIQAGDILPERIEKGISGCDTFLLIWSTGAASSDWVAKEWNRAYDLRKKIIPYCLDGTALPPALENLVHVEANTDQKVGDAALLKAVFGQDFSPGSSTLFPGKWKANTDAFGLARGTYDLELRANGQLEGKGSIDQSGLAGQLASQFGMSNMLSTPIVVHGSWSYDRNTQTLTLELSASGFGQQTRDIVKIQTTGRETRAVKGRDLAGRTWTIQRVDMPFAHKDYIKLVMESMPKEGAEEFSRNPANPVYSFILDMAGSLLFYSDVMNNGQSGLTYSVNIGESQYRATKQTEYRGKNGLILCDLIYEKYSDNDKKWVPTKTTFVKKGSQWKSVDS